MRISGAMLGRRSMQKRAVLFVGTVVWAVFLLASSTPAQEQGTRTVFIIDASGSMWGTIEGTEKIYEARDGLLQVIDDLGSRSEIGLISYGYRRKQDCTDIDFAFRPGRIDVTAAKTWLKNLTPRGRSPIATTLEMAGESLAAGGHGGQIILVTDGADNCRGDPCAVAQKLMTRDPELRMHTLILGISSEDMAKTLCIAQIGKGFAELVTARAGVAPALERIIAGYTNAPTLGQDDKVANASTASPSLGMPAESPETPVVTTSIAGSGDQVTTGKITNKRVALVVGNDRYESLPVLRKAVNDARSVGLALEDLGFEVVTGENLSRREMSRKVADLEAAIEPGDQVSFFYAGHGVTIGSENLLLPVDMPTPKTGEESLVIDEAFSADMIIRRIQSRGAGVSFIVLDACRDNPFSETGTRGIGASRGLARVDAPSGVFVLFSAGIGQSALDRLSDADGDPNSVFTRRFVPLLRTPGLTHVAIAKRVQSEVIDLAATVKHRQEPAYYDQVKGEIILKAYTPEAAGFNVDSPAAAPARSEEAEAWRNIEGTSSCGILESFVGRFADSIYGDFAKARQRELKCDEQ